MTATITVPEGLTRCPVCGEYRGTCRVPSIFDRRELEEVTVSCLCDGLSCAVCDEGRIHRPISNRFDETDGTVLHVSWYGGLRSCPECGAGGSRAWARRKAA